MNYVKQLAVAVLRNKIADVKKKIVRFDILSENVELSVDELLDIADVMSARLKSAYETQKQLNDLQQFEQFVTTDAFKQSNIVSKDELALYTTLCGRHSTINNKHCFVIANVEFLIPTIGDKWPD